MIISINNQTALKIEEIKVKKIIIIGRKIRRNKMPKGMAINLLILSVVILSPTPLNHQTQTADDTPYKADVAPR